MPRTPIPADLMTQRQIRTARLTATVAAGMYANTPEGEKLRRKWAPTASECRALAAKLATRVIADVDTALAAAYKPGSEFGLAGVYRAYSGFNCWRLRMPFYRAVARLSTREEAESVVECYMWLISDATTKFNAFNTRHTFQVWDAKTEPTTMMSNIEDKQRLHAQRGRAARWPLLTPETQCPCKGCKRRAVAYTPGRATFIMDTAEEAA